MPRWVRTRSRLFERRPDREDLALNLRAAYLETGQVGRAAALQHEDTAPSRSPKKLGPRQHSSSCAPRLETVACFGPWA